MISKFLRNLRLGYNMPPENFFNYADIETSRTPDVRELELKRRNLFFCYCDMQTGHEKHNLIKDHAKPLFKTFTTEQFALWKKKDGEDTFPVALDSPKKKMEGLALKGDLFAMAAPGLFYLDRYRQNGLEFHRRPVEIILPFTITQNIRDHRPEVISALEMILDHPVQEHNHMGNAFAFKTTAWMYQGEPTHWEPKLNDEDFYPVTGYTPTSPLLDPYYYFTRREYK